MFRQLGLLPLIAILFTACWVASESGEAPEPVISFGVAPSPLFADTLVDSDIDADVVVVGYLVVDSTGARLCGALLESYPPKCGPRSVMVTGIDKLDVKFEESQGVRWTDYHTPIWGHFADKTLTVLGGQPPSDAATRSDITGSGSNTDGEFVQSSSSDVSLGDVSCNIVSVDEIISIVGVGNDEQLVVATGAVNGDNLHCGWSSNGSRNIPNRNNLSLSDAHVTVTMMPIAGTSALDDHKLAKGFSLDNDPDAALPEYGEEAFRTGFGALMRISGDYVIEVAVIVDRTDEDLAVAKALSELVSSRLEN